MPIFTNQAQLSYNDTVINSNVATGTILDALSATKTAVMDDYTRGDDVTFVISLVNSGTTPITGLTISDDLGGYTFDSTTLYSLAYVEGSVRLYINGILQPAPVVAEGPPLVFSGINVPAGGNIILIYETDITQFAPLGAEDSVTNTATIVGMGIPAPVTVSETITPETEPELTITKSVEPTTVTENGVLTYTFIIQNFGNTPADVDDNVAVRDIFDPILTGLNVTFNGETWAEDVNYTYSEVTGLFETVAGEITVPAATYTRDPDTGAVIVTPGVSILTVRGTI